MPNNSAPSSLNKFAAAKFIAAVAAILGEVTFSRSSGDEEWGIQVMATGTIKALGCAKSTWPDTAPIKDVSTLPWSDLGHLLEACAVYGYVF